MKNLKRAFTLVELLVVVAIIGVLMSLILPAVSRARDTAVQLQCMARMRGFTMHVESYRTDHRQWYPTNSTPALVNVNLPGPYYTGSFEGLIAPYFASYDLTKVHYGQINTVKPQMNPFICPTMTVPATYTAANMRNFGWVYNNVFGNYRICSYFGYGTQTDPDNKVNRVPKREVVGSPSTMVLMGEWYGVTAFCGDQNIVKFAIYRHTNTSNITFADGHGRSTSNFVAEVDDKVIRTQE